MVGVSTLAVQPDEDATSPVPPEPAPRRPAPRLVLAVAGLVLVLAALVSGSPVALLIGLVLTATSVARRWLPLDLAVPSAALACLAVALTAGVLAAVADANLLARPAAVTVVFLVCAALAVADAARRPAAAPAVGTRGAWIAYVPAGLAAAIAWVQAATTWTAVSWSFVGTDMAQHMLLLEGVQRSGRLDYAVNGYPRALHMLLGLVSGPSMPDHDPAALLPYDLRLMSAATWLAFALMLGAAAGVTLRLARLLGTTDAVAVGAASTCSAGLLLLNPLVLSFVYMGAAPSLVAIVVLWALPLAALELDRRGASRPGPTLLAVAVPCVVLLANLWQPLAVVPVVALVVATARRRARDAGPIPRRSLLVALGVGLLAVALFAPAVLAVARAHGLATAAIAGTIDPVPLPLLVGGVVCTAVLARRWTTTARAVAGMAAGLAVMAVLLLVGSGRADVSQYYVVKSLWFLCVALLPVTAAVGVPVVVRVVVVGWRSLGRLGSMARLSRAIVVASSVALVVSFVLPIEAVVGSAALDTVTTQEPTTVSSRAYTTAVAYATRYAPAVTVPVELGSGPFSDPLATKVTAELLGFLTGQPQNAGRALGVCADVRTVAGTHPAVVITTLDPAVLAPVMRAGGCPDVPVVRVPGPPRTLAFPPDPSQAVRAS